MKTVLPFLTWYRSIILVLVVTCLYSPLNAYVRKGLRVEPRYKTWIERDVAYIITNEERQAFFNLSTDPERENFIEHFWEVRNPVPGAPTNEYKDEIYRRITHANQYFGTPGGDNGWRTARGRAYITLGEPKQRAPYFQAQQTKPMEIWFYENANPALPPYFYLIFYQKDIGDEYRLYSPYFDGPDKLTTSVNAVNDRKRALQLIDRELGREVARTTLSLVPNEPVDMDNATSGMESDLMLSVFKNLANHPLTKEALKRRGEILERVSHRTILDDTFLQVMTVPLRDSAGNTNLHYLLRLAKASDFTLGQGEKGYFYNLSSRVRVFGPDAKLIYTQQSNPSQYLNDQEFARVKSRTFGYEGYLPLAPGKYKIEFTFTNNLNKIGYRAEREVVVPAPPKRGIEISDLVAFSDAEHIPSRSVELPFSIAGFKFTPTAKNDLYLFPGQNLKFFYQLWIAPETRALLHDKKLILQYGYGRVGGRGEAKTVKEELGIEQFDRFGSLGNGKLIDLKDQVAGNYRLSVTVTDPTTSHKVFGAMNFEISQATESGLFWDIHDDDLQNQVMDGTTDYQRALTFLAQGDTSASIHWLRAALEKNPNNELVREHLADMYYSGHNFKGVVELYRGQLTEHTNETTILHVGDSMAKSGDTQSAVRWLESALKMSKESKPLNLALASYYEQLGDVKRASELKKIGERLSSE